MEDFERRNVTLSGIFVRNCAVLERTGDGVSVGRCWFHTDEKDGTVTCPRHGDVTKIQEHFLDTGKLGEDPRGSKRHCEKVA